jgi:hypothetical protein
LRPLDSAGFDWDEAFDEPSAANPDAARIDFRKSALPNLRIFASLIKGEFRG